MAAEGVRWELTEPAPAQLPEGLTLAFVPKHPFQVRVYTADEVYTGTAHRTTGQRLLDLLNGTQAGQAPLAQRFLALTDVTITERLGGTTQESPFVAINKHEILFAEEAEDYLSRGTLAERLGQDPEPFQERRTIAVEVWLRPDHRLSGTLTCRAGERPLDVLNGLEEFMPLTEVAIRGADLATDAPVGLVAVSKQRITRLHEQPAAPVPAAED